MQDKPVTLTGPQAYLLPQAGPTLLRLWSKWSAGTSSRSPWAMCNPMTSSSSALPIFEPNDQGSTSASSIRLPNGSAKKASLRLMAGKTNGSVTITTPRARSLATVSSTLVTLRQKWW
jgi:hypothetical protein